ncbi:MAG TPA: CHAD domain-containing protein [Baekduia sp.]|nr:CHAD domain-containing protein [Baekduia sp.]
MPPPVAELLLADAPDLAAATAMLAERLGAQPAGARRHDRVLLDTFDGRLRKAGLTVARPAGADAAPALDDEARAACGVRALLPVVRVRSREQDLVVRNADEKVVVRLTAEWPEALGDDGTRAALAPRLHVRGVLGYDKAYRRAMAALDGVVGGQAPPLFDEAARAVGRDPAGTSSKVRVALEPGSRADVAAGVLLGRLADIAAANVPGTIDDLDIEFLHDLRVAVRRARSVLRELRGVLDPAARDHVRTELKWVQAATGPVRDLDVQLHDFDELADMVPGHRRADLAPLRDLLHVRRAAAVQDLRATLRGRRFAAALASWRELAAAPPAAQGDPARPRAALPVEVVAADRIRAVYRRMVRDGQAIDDDSPDEALHDLRKRGKELRYLLELFGGLFPKDVVQPMVATLKDLQDVLGRFQDRAVQAGLLEDAGRDLARRSSGPAALMALGLVVEALHSDQAAARAAFGERFAPFAAKPQRRLVRATFQALA